MRISRLLDRFEEERLPLLAARTQETYRTSLSYFRAFFVTRGVDLPDRGRMRDPELDLVRRGHVVDYLTWRRKQNGRGRGLVSNRTVAKDRTTLHVVFAYAEELELREGNPVTKTRAPKADPREYVILDEPEYERLLAACEWNPVLWLYTLLLGETGARAVTEGMRVRWTDVDLERGFLRIPSNKRHRTKSGKGRSVPLTPRLEAALREHFATYRLASYDGRRPEYVFHYTRTARRAKAGERIRSFRSGMTKAIAAAELPEGFRVHDLRHRRVTTWLTEGKNPVHVKETMGHSDLRTTMGYTHLLPDHLRALVEGSVYEERRSSSA
ncbi:MAG TPA: tyrosine-type recombinase/integrase [Longimicrobiaceae bacterium]|nr:tyrosine-type recombinase/integrase [Longimicrobiaceae bacterium]